MSETDTNSAMLVASQYVGIAGILSLATGIAFLLVGAARHGPGFVTTWWWAWLTPIISGGLGIVAINITAWVAGGNFATLGDGKVVPLAKIQANPVTRHREPVLIDGELLAEMPRAAREHPKVQEGAQASIDEWWWHAWLGGLPGTRFLGDRGLRIFLLAAATRIDGETVLGRPPPASLRRLGAEAKPGTWPFTGVLEDDLWVAHRQWWNVPSLRAIRPEVLNAVLQSKPARRWTVKKRLLHLLDHTCPQTACPYRGYVQVSFGPRLPVPMDDEAAALSQVQYLFALQERANFFMQSNQDLADNLASQGAALQAAGMGYGRGPDLEQKGRP